MSIPEEIKEMVSALDHDTRWRIIELIQDKQKLSYTELLQGLSVRKGTLTHHLNRLMEAGIIDNFAGDDFAGPYSSYYELSRFGKDFIAGLLSSVQVLLPFQADRKSNVQKLSGLEIRAKGYTKYFATNEFQPTCDISRDHKYEFDYLENFINKLTQYHTLSKDKLMVKSKRSDKFA
jgi:DNA-binding transcriptional ArsR family regulator